MKRLESHHTPKHASWLNMAGIEFSVLSRACLKGRNPDALALQRQVSAYETQRNAAGMTINWRFRTDDARSKFHRFYPCLSNIDRVLASWLILTQLEIPSANVEGRPNASDVAICES